MNVNVVNAQISAQTETRTRENAQIKNRANGVAHSHAHKSHESGIARS